MFCKGTWRVEMFKFHNNRSTDCYWLANSIVMTLVTRNTKHNTGKWDPSLWGQFVQLKEEPAFYKPFVNVAPSLLFECPCISLTAAWHAYKEQLHAFSNLALLWQIIIVSENFNFWDGKEEKTKKGEKRIPTVWAACGAAFQMCLCSLCIGLLSLPHTPVLAITTNYGESCSTTSRWPPVGYSWSSYANRIPAIVFFPDNMYLARHHVISLYLSILLTSPYFPPWNCI